MKKLSDLKVGEKGVIVKIQGHGGFRKRIVEMGFIQGKIVEVLHSAPLADPIEYLILNYHVSLRRSEAEKIEIISIEEAEHLAKEHAPKSGDFVSICPGCNKPNCKFKEDIQYTDSEEDTLLRGAKEKGKEIVVALVGNPNCGKTSLFNLASGSHQRVGNYSGVTIEAIKGSMYYKGFHFTLIDLPGTYSISPYSPEEKYVLNSLINDKPDVVLNVIDSSNLERNLFLTTQLIDMNIRMVCALNMYDELEQKGDELNYLYLEELLGIPMIPTSAVKNRGIAKLFDTIIDVYTDNNFKSPDNQKNDVQRILKHIHINHGSIIEHCIDNLREAIYKNPNAIDEFTPRYLAIRLLQGDKDIEKFLDGFSNKEEILSIRENQVELIKKELHDTPENAIMDAKYGFIEGALRETLKRGQPKKAKTTTEKIDNYVTHRIWGFPIFLIALFIVFEATFTIGQFPMDWIESFFEWLGDVASKHIHTHWLNSLVCDGIISGVGSVVVFLPNILILFFCITLLEGTGYMARAAFIMDKVMHLIGLHGRSFIPLMMGFGCNVPAVMATRTIENNNARMITMLINPLMSCNARLPIYLLLTGIFFSGWKGGFVIFCIYLGGILLAGLMSKIFSKTLFTHDETPFVMELPPYRIPTWKTLLRETWDKGKQYLHKIATIVLIGSLIIWALSYFPNNGELENSYLAYIGRFIQPILAPLGFDWKISIGVLSGVAAKEIVVSTIEMLGAITSMTPAIALSLMIFTLIYFPCIATIGAIKSESGSWKWAIFTVCYTLCLAWIVAFIVYKIALLF